MKALELQVYPTFWLSGTLLTTAAPGATITEPIDVDYWSACKRLTDAELASEYWRSSSRKERMLGYGDGYGSATYEQSQIEWDRMETLQRFATLPHYDEAQP